MPWRGLRSWFHFSGWDGEVWHNSWNFAEKRWATGWDEVGYRWDAPGQSESAAAVLSGSVFAAINPLGVSYIQGKAAAINFGNVVPSVFAICSKTRYTGESSPGIILGGGDATWVHGHWGGYAGVAHYGKWNSAFSPIEPSTGWLVMCGQNGWPALFDVNGVASEHDSQPCGYAVVGASRANTKTVSLSSLASVCPSTVSETNWLGVHDSSAIFAVSQRGRSVTVQRTDSYGGWEMNLRFECCLDSVIGPPGGLCPLGTATSAEADCLEKALQWLPANEAPEGRTLVAGSWSRGVASGCSVNVDRREVYYNRNANVSGNAMYAPVCEAGTDPFVAGMSVAMFCPNLIVR